MEEAVKLANEAVKAAYPNGQVIKVFEAKKSQWGAKNASGKIVLAELVD
jgi:hypothetical protein